MNWLRRLLIPCIALILALALSPVFGSDLAAQVAKGSISGSVVDPQGGAVPKAKIRVLNKETNAEVTSESDSSGLFRVSLLPIGIYDVEISRAGFRKAALSNVQVSVGVDRDLGTIKLELGEVTSTVEVSAAPPLITSTEAQVSTSIQSSTIQTFPGVLENQGLDNLALFVPGVVNNRDLGFSNTNGTGFAVNGIRGRNNDQQIDGQNNNDNSVAGPGLFLSNPEFVQEYQITTSNFGPEYGRNSGSVVNIQTKNGTNVWHGSIFGTESNSALNTLNNTQKAFEGLKKPARFNDEFTGATIGGPWWKDKVFFFGGFDNEIVSQKQTFSTGALTPTPKGLAQLAACYPNSTSVVALSALGPYGVGGGNPIPSGSPTTRDLTISPGPPAVLCRGVEFAGVQRTLGTGSHTYDWISRIDVQTTKNHFYGRYIYNKSTFFNTDAFGTAAAGYPANVPALSQAYGVSWARTFTSRMTNEVRLNYGRLNVEFGGNSIGNTVPNQGQISTALAQITFNNPADSFLAFGPATNAPQGRIVNTYQVQDNWSYFVGRHAVKAGVNFTYQRSPNIFLPNVNGSFRFSSFSNFARNRPNRVRVAQGNPSLDFREKDTFLYFGDDFKIKNNLTLNLGITWSYYGQPANLFNKITVGRESNPSTALWLTSLPLSVRTLPEIPAPKNSWGPNVGFAWTPQLGGWLTGGPGKTVLRGGYRLTYDPPFYNIYINISSAAPNVFLQSLTGNAALANPLPAVPTGPNVRTELASSLTPRVFDPRTFNETSISPDFGPQRTHEWSFGLQREIVPNAVVEARYVGNHGTRLFQSINGNPRIDGLAASFPKLIPGGVTPCPAANAFVPPQNVSPGPSPAIGRIHCDQGVIRERTNTGFSDYHGLQLEFRGTNLFHQLTLKSAYTFSKTTDNASEIFGTAAAGGTSAFSQNQLDVTNGEHGLSGLDFRHNWTLTFSEEIPAFRSQQSVLGKILGGWVVSGSYIISSGQPYTPVQGSLRCFSNFDSPGPPPDPPSPGQCGFTNPQSSYYDFPFNNAFAGTDGALRPYLANTGAPVQTVGIFAGDACQNFAFTGSEPICSLSPTALVSLNALNPNTASPAALAAYVPAVITNKDIHFIADGFVANGQFGNPFGNAGRNALRDAISNVANFSLFKVTKLGERVTVRWHMTMLNLFNHPNFSSIDPFIDDAGKTDQGTGFANPRLFTGGILGAVGVPGRSIRFGIRIGF